MQSLEPLNMHGHANTCEEELLEVCRERDTLLRERQGWADTFAQNMHVIGAHNKRLESAVQTASAMVRHVDPDLADALLRLLDRPDVQAEPDAAGDAQPEK